MGRFGGRTDAMLNRVVREIRRGGVPIIAVANELDRQRMLRLLVAKLDCEGDNARVIAEQVVRLPEPPGTHPTDVIDWSENRDF